MHKTIQSYIRRLEKRIDKKRVDYFFNLPDNVEGIYDIPFSLADGNSSFMDIYRPMNRTKRLPLLVVLHGGGWYGGNKEREKAFCMIMAQYGFAVVCPNFRLCTKTDYKGVVQDIVGFFNQLTYLQEEYSFDMENLFVYGDGSGANLAGVVLNLMKNRRMQDYFECSFSASIRGACLSFGILEAGSLAKANHWFFYPMFGKGMMTSKILDYADYALNLPLDNPPLLLLTSKDDIARKQTLRAKDVLDSLGLENELYYWKTPHEKGRKLVNSFNTLFPSWEESEVTNQKIASFFKGRIKQ